MARPLHPDGKDVDAEPAARLFAEMRVEAKEPSPAAMDRLGKDLVLRALCEGAQGLAYHTVTGVEDGVPWAFEVGFAHVPGLERRRLVVGQNFSPAIAVGTMLDGFLRPSNLGLPYYLDSDEPIALLVHRISPSRATYDYGKQRASIGFSQAYDLRLTIGKVADKWHKQRVRQLRTGRAPEMKERKPARVTIKDAVWQMLPDAYAQASSDGAYPARARQIYYAARARVLALTGRETLGDSYFSATLLPMLMQEHPHTCAQWRVHFDPRGTLHEPHTGRRVELGTAAVASYLASWTNGDCGRRRRRGSDAGTPGP